MSFIIQHSLLSLLLLLANNVYGQITLNEMELFPTVKTIGAVSSYELKIPLPDTGLDFSVGTKITLNFANTLISTPSGALTTCRYEDTTNTNYIDYKECSCTNKVCVITVSQLVSKGKLFYLKLGTLTNPPYIIDQNVPLRVDYASTPPNFSEKTIFITSIALLPGLIQNTLLTQSSKEIGVYNSYTLSFAPSTNIVKNGIIEVKIPDEVGYGDITVKAKLYDQAEVTTSVDQPIKDKTIRLSALFNLADFIVDSTKRIVLTISNLMNPTIIRKSSSFIIRTKTLNGELMNQADSGIIAESSVPGSIIITTMEVTATKSRVINQETSLSFTFRPKYQFPNGGKMVIIFPPEFRFKASVTCNSDFGLSKDAFPCSISATSISSSGVYYPDNNNDILLQISGIINPKTTKTTGVFNIETYDSNGYLICSSAGFSSFTYTALPGALSLTADPNRNENGASKAMVLSIRFSTNNPFPKGGTVIVKIPNDQALLYASPTCKKIIGGTNKFDTPCSSKTNTTASLSISLKEWCTTDTQTECPASSDIYFEITSGLINPYFQPQDLASSLEYGTYDADEITLIEILSTNIQITPKTIPFSITMIKIERTTSTIVGEIAGFDVTFSTYGFLSSLKGDAQVFFPISTVYKNTDNTDPTCYLVSGSVEIKRDCKVSLHKENPSILALSVINVCSTACEGASQLVLRVKNVRNQINTMTIRLDDYTNYFGVRTLTPTGLIISFDKTSNVLNMKTDPGTLVPSLAVGNPLTGLTTSYVVSFNTKVEIPQTGSIQLSFPSEIKFLGGDSSCQAELKINDLLAAIDSLTCSTNPSYLTIQHKVTAESFLKGNIKITLSNVKNPISTKPSSNFLLVSKTIDGYEIEKGSFIVTIASASEFSKISIERSNTEISKPILLTIIFTISNPLVNSDKIIISLPKDQVIFLSPLANSLILRRLAPSASTSNSVFALNADNTTHLSISFSENMCNPCIEGTQMSYTIEGGNNTSLTKPPVYSFHIFTQTSDLFLLNAKYKDLSALPLVTSGNFLKLSLDVSSLISGRPTSLKITFTPRNDIPINGKLLLNLPEAVYFIDGTNNCKAINLLTGDSLTCTWKTSSSSSFGNYISEILIDPLCKVVCARNVELKVQIQSLKNPPDLTPISKSITISSQDTQLYIIDSTTLSISSYTPQTPNDLTQVILTRDTGIVDSLIALDIEIKNANKLAKESIIDLAFPKAQINLTDAPTLNCRIYKNNVLQNTNFPFLLNSNTDGSFIIEFTEFCSDNSNYCEEGSSQKFRILQGLRNPESLQASDVASIGVTILTKGKVKIEEKLSGIFTDPKLSISSFNNLNFDSSVSTVGEISTFQVTFDLISRVLQGGYFIISFNTPFILVAKEGDPTINSCYYTLGTSPQALTSCDNTIDILYGTFSWVKSLKFTAICKTNLDCSREQTLYLTYKGLNRLYYTPNSGELLVQSFNSKDLQISEGKIQLKDETALALYQLNSPSNFEVKRESTSPSVSTPYTLIFTNPNYLLKSSVIRFKLAKDQVKISSAVITPVCLIGTSNSSPTARECTFTFDPDFYYFNIIQNFCEIYCPKGFQITLKLTETENPTRIKSLNVNYFSVLTYYNNVEQQAMHVSLGKVEALPKIDVTLLKNVELKRSFEFINEEIQLTVNIKLTDALEKTGKLVLDFPNQFIYMISSTTTPLVQVLNSDQVSVQSEVAVSNAQILTGDDPFSDKFIKQIILLNICPSACQGNTDIYLRLNKIKNPKYLFPNVNNDIMAVRTVALDDYLINYKEVSTNIIYPIVQIPFFSNVAVTRSNNLPSGTTKLTLEITASSRLLPKSVIFLEIPLVQIILNSSVDQVKCRNLLNNSEITCGAKKNSSHIIINFNEYCSTPDTDTPCPKRSSFKIEITELKNQPSSAPRVVWNSISAYAKSGDFIIENLSTSTPLFIEPDLVAKDFSASKISRINNNAGAEAIYVFLIQLSDDITNDSRFVAQFPPKISYPAKNTVCSAIIGNEQGQPTSENPIGCVFNLDSLDPLGYIYEVAVDGVCQFAKCLSGKWLGFKVTVINPPSTKNYQKGAKFVISARTQANTEIMRAFVDATTIPLISPGMFTSFTIATNNDTVYNYPTNLKVVIKLRNPFPPISANGKLEIKLPTELLKKTDYISCNAKNNIYGDFTCKYSSQVVIISHTISSNSLAGQSIEVNILNLENPASNKSTSSFMLSVTGDVESSNEIFDQLTEGFNYASPNTARIDILKCNRSLSKLGVSSILDLDFRSSVPLATDTIVEIEISKSRQLDFTSNQVECYLVDNTNIALKCDRNQSRIILRSPCSTSCSNNRIGVRIHGLRNAFYSVQNLTSRPEDSFTITAFTSEGYSISRINQSVYAYPLTNLNILNVINFSRSSNTVYSHIILNITYNITTDLYSENNNLLITFPEKVFSPSNYLTLTCQDDLGKQFYCTSSVDQMSIKTILISKPCQSSTCPRGSNFTFNISGLRNFMYTYNPEDDIIIQTVAYDYKGGLEGIDKTTINIPRYFNSLTPSGLKWYSISAENSNPGANTTLNFAFFTSTPILKGSYINIYFPEKVNTTISDVTCRGLISVNSDAYCRIADNSIQLSNLFANDLIPAYIKFSFSLFTNKNVSMAISNIQAEVLYSGSIIMETKETGGGVLVFTNTLMPSDCSSPCQTCGNKPNECRSCFLPSKYPYLLSSSCVNNCTDGFFASDTTATCEPCHSDCQTCIGPLSNQCLKCNGNNYFSDFRCFESCPSLTTPSDILIPGTKEKFCGRNSSCDMTCKTCGIDPKVCYVCPNDWYIDTLTRNCISNQLCSGDYFFNKTSKSCEQCGVSCSKCKDSSDYCISCPQAFMSNNVLNGACLEQCPKGYFVDQNMNCMKCGDNCLTCEKNQTMCTACKGESENKYLEDGSCVKVCSQGMVLKNISNTLVCKMNCTNPTCDKCSSTDLSVCESCSGELPIFRNGNCINESSICSSGSFYSNTQSKTCEKCSAICKSCSGTSNTCTSCYNSFNSKGQVNFTLASPGKQFLFKSSCLYECPPGYSADYGDDIKCKPFECQAPCKKCIGTTGTICYQCNTTLPSLFEGKCYEVCPESTKYDNDEGKCVPCGIDGCSPIVWNIPSWILLSLTIIFMIYFFISLFVKWRTMNILSSIIVLTIPLEFLSKILLIGNMWSYNIEGPLALSAGNIITNSFLGLMFKTMYLSLYEEHLKTFISFKYSYHRFYQLVHIGMFIFGVNFARSLTSGLLKFPRSVFDRVKPYRESFTVMLTYSVLFSFIQLGVDGYIIYEYDNKSDLHHLAYFNIVYNLMLVFFSCV